ncbi:Hypothetical Protein PANA_2642 [Pantoea ananatis LMG 20103]|uniref:Uncharacterized protein n=1 Tax=Pantoea ananatis (strain LMG 20103) TaxID=706191 RepID=D4GJ59_PANAM|nr:Hypothetical Protein PANA_2642 [Pantoea ananatis LMG 20103]
MRFALCRRWRSLRSHGRSRWVGNWARQWQRLSLPVVCLCRDYGGWVSDPSRHCRPRCCAGSMKCARSWKPQVRRSHRLKANQLTRHWPICSSAPLNSWTAPFWTIFNPHRAEIIARKPAVKSMKSDVATPALLSLCNYLSIV